MARKPSSKPAKLPIAPAGKSLPGKGKKGVVIVIGIGKKGGKK
jgi:hypothetical protein